MYCESMWVEGKGKILEKIIKQKKKKNRGREKRTKKMGEVDTETNMKNLSSILVRDGG